MCVGVRVPSPAVTKRRRRARANNSTRFLCQIRKEFCNSRGSYRRMRIKKPMRRRAHRIILFLYLTGVKLLPSPHFVTLLQSSNAFPCEGYAPHVELSTQAIWYFRCNIITKYFRILYQCLNIVRNVIAGTYNRRNIVIFSLNNEFISKLLIWDAYDLRDLKGKLFKISLARNVSIF